MCSVCPSICEWRAVDNLVSIPNILFNFFINSTINCNPLFDIILLGNLCNFYILFLNNLANPFTGVLFIVTTRCVILGNLLHTTNITFFPATNSNFVIKSTIMYVCSFSSTSFTIIFSICLLWMGFKPYQKEFKLKRVLQFKEQMKFMLKEAKATIYKSQNDMT